MENKSRIYGMIGTIIFHGIILLWLFLFYFSSSAIPELGGGVLVNFGNVDEAQGTFEPDNPNLEAVSPASEEPVSIPIPEPVVEKPIVTQDAEKTVHIEDTKKKEEEKRKKEREAELRQQQQLQQQRLREQQAEADKKRKEEQTKANQINNLAAGAFGTGTGKGSQGSSASGEGNQGNPFGNSDRGSTSGVGGFGGSTFSLQGRSLGADGLPRPNTVIKEEGRIVVNITVDAKGNVIFAEIGGGTNIADGAMRKAALDAAKKAKFNSISSLSNNATGTITYKYLLK